MSIPGISGLGNLSSVESLLSTVLQSTGLVSNSSSTAATSTAQALDKSKLSPFASLVSQLQTLQQNNPSEYQQVTQQIATNLSSAAQSAQASGNTTLANQLSQLATDFQNASSSGQLPNLQDLANATSGHHHHHGHPASAESTSSSSDASTTDANSSSSSSSVLQQLLASMQSSATQNQSQSLNAMSIIENTLSSAGINISNS